MIVAPDFLTHWKTRALVDALAEPSAPLALIALWSHCQNSRTDRLKNVCAAMMKGVCQWPGDGKKLLAAMIETGWLEMDGADAVAHGWTERNGRLIHNWESGKKGGRPPKPKENPRVLGGEPKANPNETDKSRVEKSREDKTGEDGKNAAVPAKARTAARLTDEDFLAELRKNPAYEGLDFDREIGRAQAWLLTPKGAKRKFTRAFIVGWLNRADVPMKSNGSEPESEFAKW